jgi:hypothetical protein
VEGIPVYGVGMNVRCVNLVYLIYSILGIPSAKGLSLVLKEIQSQG